MSNSSQALIDIRVQCMESHAHTNIYSGPIMSGDQYAGWPVGALINAALPNITSYEKSETLGAFMRKNTPLYSGGIAGVLGAPPAVPWPSSPPVRHYSFEEMLCMRMRWSMGSGFPGFSHVAIHAAGDKVHTWVITKDGQALTIEDDAALYPSDALVTKLNLMRQE